MQELMQQNSQILKLLKILEEKLDNSHKKTQELQDRIKELETKQQGAQELEKDNIAKQQRIQELEELNAKLTTDKKTSDNQEKENVTSDKKDSAPTDYSSTASRNRQPVVIYPALTEPETRTTPNKPASTLGSSGESRSSSPD